MTHRQAVLTLLEAVWLIGHHSAPQGGGELLFNVS
jgi:hypothetical protein